MKTLLALCAILAVFYTVTAAPMSKKPKQQGLQPVPPPLTGQDELKPPQPKPPKEDDKQDEDQESEEETEKETSGGPDKPIPEEMDKETPETEDVKEEKETSEGGDEEELEIDLSKIDSIDGKSPP